MRTLNPPDLASRAPAELLIPLRERRGE